MTAPYAVVIGEVLIDLIEGADSDGSLLYRPRFGGSPLNVAVGVRRLGVATEFVGAFGEDVFGRRLREFLRSEGIGVGASADAGMGTVLSVAMSESGHVMYEYFGDFASMTRISPVDEHLLRNASVIHVGSTAFNADPAYNTAIDAYGVQGPFKTMDPNPRPFLIDDLPAYRARVERAMSLADLVKLSGDDLAYLYPEDTLEQAAQHIRGLGGATVIVTRAEQDTLMITAAQSEYVPVPPLELVDANGAGDSFMACVIATVTRSGVPGSLDGWRSLINLSNAAAALTCSAVGGADAMPTRGQLDRGATNTS